MGILTEDAACNLRGDVVIFLSVCKSHICVYRGDTVEKRVTFKTCNTVSRWNGVRGQENDKRLHTTPEDWKYKSIKWMCGETFWGRHTAQPQELC